MKRTPYLLGAIALAVATPIVAQEVVRIAGAPCEEPPPLHCPEGSCTGPIVTEGGPVIEAKTGRNYFLDYPCDLRPGEEVTLVLSLHGGGSYGNWQRHYFPILDSKDEHRLVIATPYSPRRVWTADDDEYLQNITSFLIDQLGSENIRAFWLAGHSQGGMTSRRIVCTEFFRDKVDGFLSLSGGRLGGQTAVSLGGRPPTAGGGGGGPAAGAPQQPPALDCEFSHIYTTGEHELRDGLTGLSATSTIADQFQCGPREQREDVVDTRGGYVHDSTRQDPPTLSWGRLPAPGRAQVYVFPNCADGRVVADVVRIDKGHTEGLEPNVTAELVRLMVSARGGKLRQE
jgi:hypothetical protein